MSPNYPSLLDRIQSTFIDLLVIILFTFAAAFVLDKYEDPPDWIRIVLFFAVWALYEPICLSLGFTIGNYIKGIRVRQYKHENLRITVFQALIRYVLKLTLGWISFISIHFNEEKRAIHDLAAQSVVIRKS